MFPSLGVFDQVISYLNYLGFLGAENIAGTPCGNALLEGVGSCVGVSFFGYRLFLAPFKVCSHWFFFGLAVGIFIILSALCCCTSTVAGGAVVIHVSRRFLKSKKRRSRRGDSSSDESEERPRQRKKEKKSRKSVDESNNPPLFSGGGLPDWEYPVTDPALAGYHSPASLTRGSTTPAHTTGGTGVPSDRKFGDPTVDGLGEKPRRRKIIQHGGPSIQ